MVQKNFEGNNVHKAHPLTKNYLDQKHSEKKVTGGLSNFSES